MTVRIRAVLRLLSLLALLAPGAAGAQGPSQPLFRPSQPLFRAPDATVEWIVRAQALACQIADTAKGAELDGLELAVQRMIDERDARVRRLMADSAPIRNAQKALENEPRLLRLEARRDSLHVERQKLLSAMEPYEARMKEAAQGGAAAGTTPRLDVVEAEMKTLDEEHAVLQSSLKTIKKEVDELYRTNPRVAMFDARVEQMERRIAKNREDWTRYRDERRGILRQVHRDRFDREYQRLSRELERLNGQIQPLEDQIKSLRKSIDDAKALLKTADLEGMDKLEQLHEINGFVDQYLSRARECIRKRRVQLASAAAATPATPATPTPPPTGARNLYLHGTWKATCSGDLPADAARSDGGDMNFYFNDAATSVQIELVTSGKVIGIDYGGRGDLRETGAKLTIVDGRGGASFYTLAWDGTIEPDFPRSNPTLLVPDKWKGSGKVTVTDIYRTGGGRCDGTWEASTP